MRSFKGVLIVTLIIIATFALSALAAAQDFDAWLKASQLGPYAPETEDWDEIYEAAKKEGKVVIYASTSRIFDAAQSFEKAYPGVKVDAYNISSIEVYEKAEKENATKIYNADILMSEEILNNCEFMFGRNMLANYVPCELKKVIPEQFREPLLVHRIGSYVQIYSDIAYEQPPIESIWELTLPEWESGFVIRDPLRSSASMSWLIALVKHHEEIAADYERMFGEPIKLTTPNAGYELIKLLLDNGLRMDAASRAILDPVTAHDIERPSIGATQSSTYRDVLAGDYQFDILWDLAPRAGYAYGNGLGIAGFAPHPNAAKLLIYWLMGGGDEDRLGFEPWHVPGNFPVRTDVETPAPFQPITEYNYWYWYEVDEEERYDLHIDVMDFWLSHI